MEVEPPFHIDTKGTCLLCLNSEKTPSPNVIGADEVVLHHHSTTALKMLLRYLKVDATKLVNNILPFSVQLVQTRGNLNLSVTLCEDCSSVTNDFLELFQAFENIRLQLDLCVGQLLQFMEEGSTDGKRVAEYAIRMNTGNADDTVNILIADRLRKETKDKCSQKAGCSLPRISLQLPQGETPNGIKEPEAITFVSTPEEISSTICGEKDIIMEQDVTDSSNSSPPMESMLPPIQTKSSTLWQCHYCSREFTRKTCLNSHIYNGHTMSTLQDQNLLPADISEEELDAAISRILHPMLMGSPRVQCQFCNCGGTTHSIKYWRSHLLQRHLEEVLQRVEKTQLASVHFFGSASMSTSAFHWNGGGCYTSLRPESKNQKEDKIMETGLSQRKSWNCGHCGMLFHLKRKLQRHQFQTHMMTMLSGHLAESVSEEDVLAAVKQISSRLRVVFNKGHPIRECFWCKLKIEQVELKVHLLESHLHEVVREVDDLRKRSEAQAAAYNSVSEGSVAGAGRYECSQQEGGQTQDGTSYYNNFM